jgi:hypothetical protein
MKLTDTGWKIEGSRREAMYHFSHIWVWPERGNVVEFIARNPYSVVCCIERNRK